MRSARVRPQSLVQVQAPLRVIAASALLLLPKMFAKIRARRESLTPAQLRALLPKMMTVIRSRRASLLAELESMGGQAPTTADFPEPSRAELERELDAVALQQLIRRVHSQWKKEGATLRAAIEEAREFASSTERGERRRQAAIAVAHRERDAAEAARAAAKKGVEAAGAKRHLKRRRQEAPAQ